MGSDLEFLYRPMVVVTGFGPFANHPVNASWEAVRLINKDELEKRLNIDLVLLEIPVTYENVDEFAPALWETHTPKVFFQLSFTHLNKTAFRQHYYLRTIVLRRNCFVSHFITDNKYSMIKKIPVL